MKVCTKCGLQKNEESFYKLKSGKNGIHPWCKECVKIANKSWAQTNPDKRKEIKKRHTAKKYGLSIEEFDSLLHSQGGVCAVCGSTDEKYSRSLAVDHCHKTGKVRGLLCTRCNQLLGSAEDSTELLKNLIHYLEKNNNGSTSRCS